MKSLDSVITLPNNTHIVSTSAGKVLVNSPPETLKILLAEGFQVPKIILVSPDVPAGQFLGSSGFVHQGINYASVEFLLFANYFLNGGDRTTIVTVTENQKKRMQQILQETIVGPENQDDYYPYPWVQRECEAMAYVERLGRPIRVDDIVTIRSLEKDGGKIEGDVTVTLVGDAFIFTEAEQRVASVSTTIDDPAMPLMLAPPLPIQRQEITLQFIGGSDGFDPEGITTCFLAYFGATGEDSATLFDVAAYLRVRLGNLGISPSQIAEVFISHVHEDHIAGLPELLLMGGCRVKIITSNLVYLSLLRVLSAILAVPEDDVAVLFDFCPLEPDKPITMDGKVFEAIYAIHSIPTLAVRVNDLCYSGDMRYDETWFGELEDQGILSRARRQELGDFARGTTILVQDAGGGAIHTSVTPEVLDSLASKSKHIILTHTPKHNQHLPETHQSWPNIVYAEHGFVKAVGQTLAHDGNAEKLETISACPLYARLSISERNLLAQQVTIEQWNAGDTILDSGAACEGATYIVHNGLTEIWQGSNKLQVVGRGASIGERCALVSREYALSAKAHTDVRLLKLDSGTFQSVAKRLGLRAAIDRADQLWDHPIFCRLPWGTLLDLALDFQPLHLPTGHLLFEYGTRGHECYLLLSGAVTILNNSLNPIGVLAESGEFFGARSLLFDAPRNAHACISEDAEIWVLPAPALKRLQFVYPGVILHLRTVESMRTGDLPLVSALDPLT